MSSDGTMVEERPLRRTSRTRAVVRWIRQHDESWLFVAGYVTLAVVLSIWISLFWLVAVVGVHFVFELVRQAPRFPGRGEVAAEALWEVKLDIALVILAVVVGLYMEFVLGILGLRSAGQLGAAIKGGSRVAAWQGAIRGILLSVDDALLVARSFIMRGETTPWREPAHTTPREPEALHRGPTLSLHQRWTLGDWFSLILLAASTMLALLAPLLTDHSLQTALETMISEMRPLP